MQHSKSPLLHLVFCPQQCAGVPEVYPPMPPPPHLLMQCPFRNLVLTVALWLYFGRCLWMIYFMQITFSIVLALLDCRWVCTGLKTKVMVESGELQYVRLLHNHLLNHNY